MYGVLVLGRTQNPIAVRKSHGRERQGQRLCTTSLMVKSSRWPRFSSLQLAHAGWYRGGEQSRDGAGLLRIVVFGAAGANILILRRW